MAATESISKRLTGLQSKLTKHAGSIDDPKSADRVVVMEALALLAEGLSKLGRDVRELKKAGSGKGKAAAAKAGKPAAKATAKAATKATGAAPKAGAAKKTSAGKTSAGKTKQGGKPKTKTAKPAAAAVGAPKAD